MTKPVAVVVGAGPGLGSAVARRFAAAGFAVAVARRRAEELAALPDEAIDTSDVPELGEEF